MFNLSISLIEKLITCINTNINTQTLTLDVHVVGTFYSEQILDYLIKIRCLFVSLLAIIPLTSNNIPSCQGSYFQLANL